MTDWDKTKPDGAEPWQFGDDFIRDNNDALEEALARHSVFPGNGDANRGLPVLPVYADALALIAGITTPVVGMQVWVTDHRQSFTHDGVGWRSTSVAIGDLADRDAITNSIAGARWLVEDHDLYFSMYEGLSLGWVAEQKVVSRTQVKAGPITVDEVDEILATGTVVVPDDGRTYHIAVVGKSVHETISNANNTKNVALNLDVDLDAAGTPTVLDTSFAELRGADPDVTQTLVVMSDVTPAVVGSHEFRLLATHVATGGSCDDIVLTLELVVDG